MKRLLAFLLLLVPAAASAQEGTIRYDRAVRYDFEVPEAWAELKDQIPSANVSVMLLLFNESASLMIPAPVPEKAAPRDEITVRAERMVMRLKMGSTSRGDQENLLGTYVSQMDGTYMETREFMGRTFLISDAQPSFEWTLSGEQAELLGFMVQKATALLDGKTVEAWFTPEIPVSAGPGSFGGLPGVILALSVDDGQTTYAATEVTLDALEEGSIQAPEDGDEVSRDEYEEIVVEKLEELKTTRGVRRRGGTNR